MRLVLESEGVAEDDKLRLFLIWAITQEGVTEQELEPLLHAGGLSRHSATMKNLESINVNLAKKGPRPTFFKSKSGAKPKPREFAYDLARYTPPLEGVMQLLAEGKLDKDAYPYVNKPPTERAAAPVNPKRLGMSVRTVSIHLHLETIRLFVKRAPDFFRLVLLLI